MFRLTSLFDSALGAGIATMLAFNIVVLAYQLAGTTAPALA